MPSSNNSQSTIDKLTWQIMAKIVPTIDNAISRAVAAGAAAGVESMAAQGTTTPSEISQSTIDKITEQIMAKFIPALENAVSRNPQVDAASTAKPTGTSAPKVLQSLVAPDLGTAQWIWTHETPYTNPPFGPRAFRKLVIIPSGESVDSMIVDVSCHYAGCLFVNGKMVGHIHSTSMRFSIKFALTDHVVVVATATQQHGTGINKPAGLMVSAVVWSSAHYKGRAFAMSTDASWETSITAVSAQSGFTELNYKPDSSWNQARVEGPFGMAPWTNTPKPITTTSVNNPPFLKEYCDLKPFDPQLATNGPAAKDII